MSFGFTCNCASPDCMVNGCALYRRYQEMYRWTGFGQTPQVGWTCPNCGAGVAPDAESCPHCRPVATWSNTTTELIIETPILEGENHERPSNYQPKTETSEEDQG